MVNRSPLATLALVLLALLSLACDSRTETIWVEGEHATKSTMHRHPWWYDKVKKDRLSGGDFISNFDFERAGEAEYAITAQLGGKYEFWVRANPVQSTLSYKLNGAEKWTPIEFK